MNNLNIPIYRAKKLDCDEYVIGYSKISKEYIRKCLDCGGTDIEEYNYDPYYHNSYYKCKNCHDEFTLEIDEEHIKCGYLGRNIPFINGIEIDPTTLEISFNNSKSWKTIEEVQTALGIQK